MCGTTFLQMCSFFIIWSSFHSLNLSFSQLFYVISLYLSFHLYPLHCHSDFPHFLRFHRDFLHSHADSPHPNSYSFFSIWVFFREHSRFTRIVGEAERYLFNSSLPFLPTSLTLRHQPGDYCRGITSPHSQQPEQNRKPLVSECKLVTTKLPTVILRISLYFSILAFSLLSLQSLKI